MLHGQFLHCRSEERADAVGDEIRRILARDYSLAEMQIAEFRDERENFGTGGRPWNDLGQVQIAGRVEEMSAEEVLAEFVRIAFGNLRERDAAGVGGNDHSGCAMRDDFVIESALDGEILRDGFDDPA